MSDGPDLVEIEDLAGKLIDEVGKLATGSWVPRSELESARREIERLRAYIESLRRQNAELQDMLPRRPLLVKAKNIPWLLTNLDPYLAAEIESRMPKDAE